MESQGRCEYVDALYRITGPKLSETFDCQAESRLVNYQTLSDWESG